VAPDVAEVVEGDPERVVIENARRKARAGKPAVCDRRLTGGPALVLGVDTEVVLDGRTLGKAVDHQDARERLEALSGRTHSVLSGVVLLRAARPENAGDEEDSTESAGAHWSERSGIARTAVTFHRLDPATVERYLESGEWRDRAGAYAIQGLGSILIERVEGDFSNVVGLPLGLLVELLAEPFAGAGDSAPEGSE
jgi:septum formation protein